MYYAVIKEFFHTVTPLGTDQTSLLMIPDPDRCPFQPFLPLNKRLSEKQPGSMIPSAGLHDGQKISTAARTPVPSFSAVLSACYNLYIHIYKHPLCVDLMAYQSHTLVPSYDKDSICNIAYHLVKSKSPFCLICHILQGV